MEDTPAEEPVSMELETPAEQTAQATTSSASDLLKGIVAMLERSVKTKDTRLLMGRLLRQTAVIRKQLGPAVLQKFLRTYLPADSETFGLLHAQLDQIEGDMLTDEAAVSDVAISSLPEVEMYAHLLTLILLVDKKKLDQAKAVATKSVQRLNSMNRRTLDVIAARIYFYYSWAYESTNALAEIRSTLLGLYRTAVLRHDAIGQETLLNLLLRNFLHYNLYDQAEKFRAKAQNTDQFKSHQQFCRYLFYLGRIRAVQLEYTDAKEALQQAVRKAPASAQGFRIAATKWLCIVRLLLGEIPARSEFDAAGMKLALLPYFKLSQAVRSGDLTAFNQVAAEHKAVFWADKTANLITRLHHNVIRTGLRRLNLAYSRISLADVAAKLGLPSAEDAEYIVAKAIRDGGVDAVLDHENGHMQSKELLDVYSTSEPQTAFHARIAFCLDIHNEAVKAMRFEPDAHKKKLAGLESRRVATEQELAKAMEDADDEF